MGLSINEITSGIGIRVDDQIYIVADYSHVKPGKGAAFVRVKLKNIKTNLVIERTFKTADRIDDVFLEEKTLQYLYRAGDDLHFMDQNSYEQHMIQVGLIGDGVKYLKENLEVTATFFDQRVQRVILPNFIVFKIFETEPGIKGDSARSGNKPAKIDTGAAVSVPLFINVGDHVKIDTRSGQYVERVQQ